MDSTCSGGPLIAANGKRIADLALKSRLPSMSGSRRFVDIGGLMFYGADRADSRPQNREEQSGDKRSSDTARKVAATEEKDRAGANWVASKGGQAVKKLFGFFHRTARDEQGITGLETAIILIAFVVVATIFAFVVLTTGVFSAERGKETVFAGLEKARGSMEVRGGVVVTATGTTLAVDDIQFAVANTAGGEPVPLNPSGVNNRTVVAYRDDNVVDNDVTYTVTNIVGDTDTLLEPGELKVITIDVAAGVTPAPTLDPNEKFTVEVQTPVGATLDITRSLPSEFRTVMQLH